MQCASQLTLLPLQPCQPFLFFFGGVGGGVGMGNTGSYNGPVVDHTVGMWASLHEASA